MPIDSAALLEAVGELLAEQEAAHAKALEQLRDELGERLEALPPPAPGAPGKDGAPGIDRVLAAPATIGPEEHCPRNTIAHHKAGLWQAIRETTGDPTSDPAGWKCLIPGIAEIECVADHASRTLEARFITSDGYTRGAAWRMPATYLPHDWQQRGWGIIAGDILRDEGIDYVALCDAPGNPLAAETADNWQRITVIGRRGKAGEQGPPGTEGPPGPGLTGLTLVRDPAGPLAIAPQYADKRVKSEPIAVDLMLEPPEPGLDLITGFAGGWHTGKRYARGVVVSSITSSGPALWLSLKSDNREPLGQGGWRRMI